MRHVHLQLLAAASQGQRQSNLPANRPSKSAVKHSGAGGIKRGRPALSSSPPAKHSSSPRQQTDGTAQPNSKGWDATELGCSHFVDCSGCTLSSDLSSPPILAKARAYFACHGVELGPLVTGPPHEWRRRARLAVRGEAGNCLVGLYRAGTHDVVAIPDCRAHHPAINATAALVKRCADALRVPPYDEPYGGGLLRYIQVTAAEGQRGVQLVLVWNSEAGSAASDALLQRLASLLWRSDAACATPLLHSVWANHHAGRSNAILGPSSWVLLRGEARLWQQMGGARVCLGPDSFCQANFDAMGNALEEMARWVPSGSDVLDLHAGIGTIGLSLAATANCQSVTFVEVHAGARAHFEAAAAHAKANGHVHGAQLAYHVSRAGDAAATLLQQHNPQVVVLDPPRKGLEPTLLAALYASPSLAPRLHTLLYLSCGFPALMQDTDALLAQRGGWRLVAATAFLFFPGTSQLETLAVFQRRRNADN